MSWATDAELCRLWDIAAHYCNLGSQPTRCVMRLATAPGPLRSRLTHGRGDRYLTSSQFHRVLLRSHLVGRRDPPPAGGTVLEYGAVDLIYSDAIRGEYGAHEDGAAGTPSRRDATLGPPAGDEAAQRSPHSPGRRAGVRIDHRAVMGFPQLLRAVHLVAARLAPWAVEETLDAQRRRVLLAILRYHHHIADRREKGLPGGGARREARPHNPAVEVAADTEAMPDALEYPSFASLTDDPALGGRGGGGEGIHLGAASPREPGMYSAAATPGERMSSLWHNGGEDKARRLRPHGGGARRESSLDGKMEVDGGGDAGWAVPTSRAAAPTPPTPRQ